MDTQLQGVPPQAVGALWSCVENMIAAACAKSRGRFKAEDIRQRCADAEMQMWMVVDANGELVGVIITETLLAPQKKLLSSVLFAGSGFRHWIKHFAEIEAWGRSVGCQAVQLIAPPALERLLPDYEKTHILIEKEL